MHNTRMLYVKISITETSSSFVHQHQPFRLCVQMEALGERIEHHLPQGQLRHLSVPLSPMENIYTMQALRLAQLKLRIGHAMSRNLAKDIRNGSAPFIAWM